MTTAPNILVKGYFSPAGANHFIAASKAIEAHLNDMLMKQNVLSSNDTVSIQGFYYTPYYSGISIHVDVFNTSTGTASRPDGVISHVMDQLRWYGYSPERINN